MTSAKAQLRRLLDLLPRIADGNEHDVNEVAARIGVDAQTLLRDLQALVNRFGDPGGYLEGVQIHIESGRISVTSDHFLRPMGLTIPELCALELGLAILRAERPPDEDALIEKTRDRLRKLIAGMPPTREALETRYAELAPTDGLPHLATIRKALRDYHKVRITYGKSGAQQATSRVARPYSITPANGMWYAIAYCEESQGLRVFRMDRVEGAEVLAETYQIPESFSVRETLREGKALQLDQSVTGMKVRYSPRIARWISDHEGVPLESDGSLTIEHPLADPDWGVRHVLQYAGEAEVLEPPEMREEIIRRLDAISGERP